MCGMWVCWWDWKFSFQSGIRGTTGEGAWAEGRAELAVLVDAGALSPCCVVLSALDAESECGSCCLQKTLHPLRYSKALSILLPTNCFTPVSARSCCRNSSSSCSDPSRVLSRSRSDLPSLCPP